MIKEKQKIRNMRLFIDATISLINEEGYDNVSIRKVGDRALFNSATIYNYFNNIDHLKSIAAVGMIEDYINELKDVDKISNNSYQLLLNVWKVFLSNVYRYPKTFHVLFARKKGKYTSTNMKTYYDVYPDKIVKMPKVLNEMLLSDDLKSRSMHLLNLCKDDGYFKEVDLDDIDNQLIYVFHGLLNDVIASNINDYDSFMSMGIRYINNILNTYKLK